MKRSRLALAVLTLVLPAIRPGVAPAAPVPPAAGDAGWTRFRGLNGSGVVPGRYSADLSEKDVAWKAELPGKGHASPVIWKDRVYTTAADADEGKRYVLCLNAADGAVVWKKEFDFSKFRQHADNSFASATPAVDDLGVYVAWVTPEAYVLFSLDHDGKERWSADLGPFKSQQGQGTSPVVVGEAVVIVNDQEGHKSGAFAFDRRTGVQHWKLDRPTGDKTAMSTPVLFTPKPGGGPPQLIFTSKASGLTAVDPHTGQVLWEAREAFDARTVGSPVVTDDLVIAACGEGADNRTLVALRPPSRPDEAPAAAYVIKRIAPYVPTPVVKGNRLYMWGDAGLVTCAEADTGKTVWSEKVGGMYYGSPVCVGDTLWCVSRKGELVGVAAADAFKKVGKVELGEASHATPAVAGGKMYVRTVSHMVCLKLRAG
jgi:outer membrane protein assembly factor BamB